MTLSEELTWRGFVNQTTFTDLSQLDSQKWTFYHGYDASADSQTVGNLAAMMLDRLMMRHGNRAIILAGGATSLIGDPGGKDAERPLQTEETIAENVSKAEEQLKKVFQDHEFTMVNNLDWTRDLKVIPFLRDIGKHFSMTPLVQRDYIARRMGEDSGGISYAEFSYTILQGMDYLHLFDEFDCRLQLGGSDQWGNCLSGVDLIRRSRGEEVHVITQPLIINKSTGKKFGKTEDGAIWLDPAKTSPTQFYQFWINTDDAGAEDYLKIFTELDKQEIENLVQEHKKSPELRLAQEKLAILVTRLVHGQEAADIAQQATEVLTNPVGALEGVSDEALGVVRNEIASVRSTETGSIIQSLVETGLASSNTEARRLISSNAVYVNNKRVERDNFEPSDFIKGHLMLRRGKAFKDSALIELN